MFARWGRLVVSARWAVVVAGAVLVVAGATWGSGVFGALASGGFLDTHTPSAHVRAQLTAAFGAQDSDAIVLYSSPTLSATDPGFRAAVTSALDKARSRSEVASIVSYYTSPQPAPTLLSRDGHQTYVVVTPAAGRRR